MHTMLLGLVPVLAQIPPGVLIGAGVVLVVLIWFIGTYNGLVRLRNHCDESWSNVDTELKRRYDLIPNLVNTVKGYASHEREVFQAVVDARNKAMTNEGTPESQAKDENQFVGAVRQLFGVVEAYPDLKASDQFLALQQELTNTENKIQRARRFYNGNVRDFANRIETFPSNLVAGLYNFTKREFFEIEDSSQKAVPRIDLD